MENKVLEQSAKDKATSATKQGRVMSDVAIASELIKTAYPPGRHGNVKAACWAAYRGLKLASERRARAIWNREARRIDAHEMDALRRAAIRELEYARSSALERITEIESMAEASRNRGL